MRSDALHAGDLNRRIVITRATILKDAMGQSIQTWNTLTTVWANYMPISDAEKVRLVEVYAEMSVRFRIRWSASVSDVNAKDRINFDGRVFDIIGVKELGKRVMLEISAGTRGER